MLLSKNEKIAFQSPYPFDTAPGQRFRYEQYLKFLKDQGYQIKTLAFLNESTHKILYKKGHTLQKLIGIGGGFFRRFFHLIQIIPCDFVFIFREASPIGFPIFEWIIAKVLRKKIIYDFDDAIWLPNTSQENIIARNLKFHQKVGMICRWSYKVSVGNEYLKEFASQYTKNVIINPTTIDTDNYHNQVKNQEPTTIVIGWTGTHSTLKYLNQVLPILKKLETNYEFIFEVIADKEIKLDLKNFRFTKWNKESEIADLLSFNIGLMPLTDDQWSKGKCGFKALQYMSLGIPAVVSPVGVNSKIVTDGLDGFICDTQEDWLAKLALLITDNKLRQQMGVDAIKKIKKQYSVNSNKENFLSLFRS